LAVEGIAYDGAVQSVRVGGVYTKLVGTAGFGVEGIAGIMRCIQILRFAQDDTDNLITCNRRFAVFEADHLQGTIVEVGPEGEADEAFRFLSGNKAIE